ncbi:hypothetical protein ACFXDH_49925 [Streptomyces sp. NPDC059467]|uniref:hypothetical protein n=1 Tax=Streptomyces sp. NPDC059467 TaxID=3346844 RepID=UPI0036A272C7
MGDLRHHGGRIFEENRIRSPVARRAHGRASEPTAAVVDAQSAKTSSNIAETSQGIDAGKINGRKRHLVVDTRACPCSSWPPLPT